MCVLKTGRVFILFFGRLQEDRNQKNVYIDTSDAETVDLASEFGTVRRIDAGLLNWKHMSVAIPIVLISAAAYFFRKHNPPF